MLDVGMLGPVELPMALITAPATSKP